LGGVELNPSVCELQHMTRFIRMKREDPSIAKIIRPGAKGIYPRKRLFRLLDKGRKFPVIWVTGPPGSGKTSLAASYLDARKLPCLWYQVDERDADIATFFYYMGMAAMKAAPRKGNPLPFLTPEYLSGIPAFTRRYFEGLYSRLSLRRSPSRRGPKREFIVVFDNYQDVSVSSAFHEMVAHGFDVIPEGIHVMVLSRNEPPPQLARLRANNKIRLLGWEDIQFTVEETREILRTKGKRRLAKKTLLELHKKTEGWAAGLMLILLDLRFRKIDYLLTSAFPTREIYNYFAIEIFNKMPKETQEFLLKTTFFPRMTAEMAERLTGVRNSVEILYDLSEHHYFTEKYLGDNPVYQYHPLFREFLLSKAQGSLGADEVSLIRQNAAAQLEESGRTEEAAALFRDAEDWKGLVRLLLRYAQSLTLQGRNKSLEKWIESIPKGVREAEPWLLYWLGVSKQPFGLSESRILFEQAFQLFQERQDVAGTFLAWSGAVDTIVFEWNDFTLLDHWFEWFDECIQRDPFLPSPDIEARVASSMAGALLHRKPFHPDMIRWMERSLSLCREKEDFNLTMQACLNTVNYHSWMGDLAKCSLVTEEIRKMAQSRTASPLWVLTWKWIEALIYNRTTEGSELALRSISEGLKIATEKGIHVWDDMLFAQGVYASLNKGDTATADEFLKKMETTLESSRRHGLCQYQYLSAWHNLLTGNISGASLYAEKAYELSEKTGMYFTRILCSLLMGQVFYEEGDHQKARAYLMEAKNLVRRSGSVSLEYMCLIREAQFGLDGEGEVRRQGLEALREAMELGRKHRYTNLFPWWQPSAMAHLCARALDEGITVDYAQSLVRKHNLIPDEPPLDIENWPWPLKIHTLGRFEILKDEKPIQFSGKVQKKPLLLLKALIALGGKEINEEQLSDMLWPDADGDQAHSAFTTNLSRLRQLLGIEKALRFQEGKATLDNRYCRVDAWAFERIVGQAEAVWNQGGQPAESDLRLKEVITEGVRLTQKALGMYKGHFLPADEAYFWTTSYRERLRSKYLRAIMRLGNYLKETGQWEKAIEFYEGVLEVDDLAEEIYQEIMVCYRHLNEYAKAIANYQRCRKNLSSALGIDPSPKTKAIYRTLIGIAK
jgi:ATP/maltotriose-dependent transcriptional regulator MalT/DNA-binding SARP family transcriptional activator